MVDNYHEVLQGMDTAPKAFHCFTKAVNIEFQKFGRIPAEKTVCALGPCFPHVASNWRSGFGDFGIQIWGCATLNPKPLFRAWAGWSSGPGRRVSALKLKAPGSGMLDTHIRKHQIRVRV